MHEIHLSDELHREARRAAEARGFDSVEEYITSLIDEDLHDESFDDFFTPEIIAELDRISLSIRQGAKMYTMEEVAERLNAKKAAWLEKHAS
jgi:hypothetical protein